ncbi:MAG TPA: 2-hydroxychromene-2-carboxylate isomerase, partial [Burkholderiales bacterium]|nr:2-hydroxychromene-2-carboxylate isomerase [Burkholderiales bacterium]
FGSNYSYLSVMRIEQAAASSNVVITWRPFLLGPIFKSFGWDNSPFVLQKEKGDYMWKDMSRQCRKYDIPWKKPATFPRLAVLPLRVALFGAREAWIGEFCRQIMLLNFCLDRDVNSEESVGAVLAQLNLPAGEIIQAAQSEQIKERLREQTEAARRRGIFGAPTFFVGNEMFWGNDRLDDALAMAAGSQDA